jgi:anti-sigma B factor antagonist
VIQASPFEIRSGVEADTGRLILAGELDIATAPQVEDAARMILAQRVTHLIIDLSALTFIDSSGLRMLIALNDAASHAGWSLALIRPEPPLSVLQITGADENLPFIEESPSP